MTPPSPGPAAARRPDSPPPATASRPDSPGPAAADRQATAPAAARRPLTPPPVPRELPDEGALARRPTRAAGRRFPRLAAALGVVVLATAALWLVQAVSDDPAGGRTGSSPTAFPTASPTSAAPGYRLTTAPGGVTLAVPTDWTYQLRGTAVTYAAPDYASFLDFGPVPTNAVTDRMELARAFSRGVAQVWPGYVVKEIGTVGEGPDAAVEVEYAYETTDGSERRGLYRVFTAPDDTTYEVQVAAPSTEWPRQRQVMDTLLSTFYVRPS
ncbi:hypothetical protein [Streptomyces sp. NPDC047886]|uniref:hypothetical protein n=1 Tax=Streptomyces sp. NPDC047886 TaxID=3365490 RepID=UPI00370FB740